jgi:hypothetical protein
MQITFEERKELFLFPTPSYRKEKSRKCVWCWESNVFNFQRQREKKKRLFGLDILIRSAAVFNIREGKHKMWLCGARNEHQARPPINNAGCLAAHHNKYTYRARGVGALADYFKRGAPEHAREHNRDPQHAAFALALRDESKRG